MIARPATFDADADPGLPAPCLIVAVRNGHSRKRAENCTLDRFTGRGDVDCPDCPYAPHRPARIARVLS